MRWRVPVAVFAALGLGGGATTMSGLDLLLRGVHVTGGAYLLIAVAHAAATAVLARDTFTVPGWARHMSLGVSHAVREAGDVGLTCEVCARPLVLGIGEVRLLNVVRIARMHGPLCPGPPRGSTAANPGGGGSARR